MKSTIYKLWIVLAAMECLVVYFTVTSLNDRFDELQLETRIINGTTRFATPKGSMTLVTAYFDIGRIAFKGFDKETYKIWASTFRYIATPLVVFTDSEDFFSHMTKTRAYFPEITRIIKMDKNNMWPFQSIEKIRRVFSQPEYPKHVPNTVMPQYAALQHSKYALVAHAIKNNFLKTDWYAWIDIGYFRDMVNNSIYFRVLPPIRLNSFSIGYTQVFNRNATLTPMQIFKQNAVWIGGGMFIGKATVLLQFEAEYQRAFNYFLELQLMNTDQQLIYALYSDYGRKVLKPEIEIQLFYPGILSHGNIWFYLGNSCRYFLPKHFCPLRALKC